MNINQVSVVSVIDRVWDDNCLELPASGEICQPAMIAGYRIILRIGVQEYKAHTNLDGSAVRWVKL